MTEPRWALTIDERVERHEVNTWHGPLGEPAALATGAVLKLEGVERFTMPDGQQVVYFPGDFAGTRGITPVVTVVETRVFRWQAEDLANGVVEVGVHEDEAGALAAAQAVAGVADKAVATKRVVLLDEAQTVLADVQARDIGVLLDEQRKKAVDNGGEIVIDGPVIRTR